MGDADLRDIVKVLRYKCTLSRLHTKMQNKKGRQLDHDVDVKFLIQLFIKQTGRCTVSRMPFPMSGNDEWVISIDRINGAVGYVKTNVRLICEEFNVAAGINQEKWNDIYNGVQRIHIRIRA